MHAAFQSFHWHAVIKWFLKERKLATVLTYEVAKNVISIGIWSLQKSSIQVRYQCCAKHLLSMSYEGALAFSTITHAIPAGLWSKRHSECWKTFPFALEIIGITIFEVSIDGNQYIVGSQSASLQQKFNQPENLLCNWDLHNHSNKEVKAWLKRA